MNHRLLRIAPCLLVGLLVGCESETSPGGGAASSGSAAATPEVAEEAEAFAKQPLEFEDWYPAEIKAPEGTEYPCALTALPKELTGVPPEERRFVNHIYTCVFDSIQAKQVILQALVNRDPKLDGLLESYTAATTAAVEKIRAELAPADLHPFREKVIGAIELQQTFFSKATALSQEGAELEKLWAIPEGRQASSKLLAAWGDMSRRYPGWGPEVKDSVYHHLCALDLF